MTTLATVLAEGPVAARPAFGKAGCTFYTTDTKEIWYDNGTAWVNVTPSQAPVTVALAPSAAGNFTVAHGLSAAPSAVIPIPVGPTGGQIWLQSPGFDATNLYLVASDAGVSGIAVLFK